MINLIDACITDGLSDVYKDEPWVQAISYACKKMQELIFTFADRLHIWYHLDSASDVLLDILAIELRVVAYDTTLSHSKKVELIKNAFLQWSKAGTTEALEEIATIIFENAKVVEWYEYEGTPSHFKIQTTNPKITGTELEKLKEVVKDYKRLSTTIDEVEILSEVKAQTQRFAFGLAIGEIEHIPKMKP